MLFIIIIPDVNVKQFDWSIGRLTILKVTR